MKLTCCLLSLPLKVSGMWHWLQTNWNHHRIMYLDKGVWREEGMQNTIRENIEIFIVTKNSTFRYQLLLWYTESKRNLTSQTHYTSNGRPSWRRTLYNTKRRARSTATPAKAEKDRDFASVRYCSSLVGGQMLCSRSAAGRHSAIDRQQFRFTCVLANAISDTRHGWQPVSTASCRGRTELGMACYFRSMSTPRRVWTRLNARVWCVNF